MNRCRGRQGRQGQCNAEAVCEITHTVSASHVSQHWAWEVLPLCDGCMLDYFDALEQRDEIAMNTGETETS